VRYLVPIYQHNRARYVRWIRLQVLGLIKYIIITSGVLPNKLTPLYSKNYYKEENYLTIKIASLYT
jgi:hypothetical protein